MTYLFESFKFEFWVLGHEEEVDAETRLVSAELLEDLKDEFDFEDVKTIDARFSLASH